MNKKLLSLFVLFVFFVSVNMKTLAEARVELKSRLQKRNEIIYIGNEKEPYTGVLVDFYENGQLKAKGNVKSGKKDGEFITYYENGQLKMKVSAKSGKPDGEFIAYHENGQIKQTGTYKAGKPDGEFIAYHKNGKIKLKEHYLNDKRQS